MRAAAETLSLRASGGGGGGVGGGGGGGGRLGIVNLLVLDLRLGPI